MSSSGPTSSSSAEVSTSGTATFDDFYKDLKETEKKDSVLTPKQQIERLLRPGASYRNLNPFEVLQVDPEDSADEAKKKYRRLSILVHPDKNRDDPDRAQAAFDAVKKAHEMLSDEKLRKKCLEIVEEAKGRTDKSIAERKHQLKKQGKPTVVEEDSPAQYKRAVQILTMKLFADLERRRRELEQKISQEAAKKREMELLAEERRNVEQEFTKNWEESRQGRVNSWLDFRKGNTSSSSSTPANDTTAYSQAANSSGFVGKEKKKKKEKKKFSPLGFRPPKHKPESR